MIYLSTIIPFEVIRYFYHCTVDVTNGLSEPNYKGRKLNERRIFIYRKSPRFFLYITCATIRVLATLLDVKI